mmetsp:Transcript_24544/g.56581  ORF Transcript_24544/g.56581 Transcript_24544/m.56581 type:complete len:418 (-) Transcript_24544:992-2245(-)
MWGNHAFVSSFDAIHFPYAICIEQHDNFTDHGIQARTEPATCNNGSDNLLRLKVKRLTWPGLEHLQAHAGLHFGTRTQSAGHPRLVAEELESLPLERRFNRGGRWPSRGEMLRAESPHLIGFLQENFKVQRLRGRKYFVQVWSQSCLRLATIRCNRRLLGGEHQPREVEIADLHRFGRKSIDGSNWQQNKPLEHLANHGCGVSCHCSMDSILRQNCAIDAVIGVLGNCPDHVGRVQVLHSQRQLQLLELVNNLLFQPKTNVDWCLCGISGFASDLFAYTIGDNNDCIALRLHEVDNVARHLVKVNPHLWQQAQVHIASGKTGSHADVAGCASHELHQTKAVSIAHRLGVCGVYRLPCFSTCCVEAARLVQQRNIVFSTGRYCHNRTLPLRNVHSICRGLGCLQCAIAANDEVLPYTH